MPDLENSSNPAGIPAGIKFRCTPIHDGDVHDGDVHDDQVHNDHVDDHDVNEGNHVYFVFFRE